MYQFSERSKKNLEGLHPTLKKLMQLSIGNSPIDFTVVHGVRTAEEQKALYEQGRTVPGSIVTNFDGYTKQSNHQIKEDGFGYAVDIYPFVDGKVQVNDAKSLIRISEHIKAVARLNGIKIEWGGDWTMRDYPHFELKYT